jgi:arsenate reductase (thioredoxin)
MKKKVVATAIVLTTLAIVSTDVMGEERDILEPIRPLIAQAIQEFDQIGEERRAELGRTAAFIRSKTARGKEAQLTFVCTHNSRRSHMAQIMAQTAALHYGVPKVKTFSGGTESTACNIRTVRALRRAGFSVVDTTGGKNPLYLVQYGENAPAIKAFSKVYSGHGNPTKDFAAMMCCSHADGNCPVVEGAVLRIPIHYEDPKKADGTPGEPARYTVRLRQVAREMLFLMSLVKDA